MGDNSNRKLGRVTILAAKYRLDQTYNPATTIIKNLNKYNKMNQGHKCFTIKLVKGRQLQSKGETVTVLARDTQSYPDIYPYQIFSEYLKEHENYGPHKVLSKFIQGRQFSIKKQRSAIILQSCRRYTILT